MRLFTAPQLALLASSSLHANLLVAFYLDEGTYRFCDDVVNLSDGTNTWTGASALVSDIEFQSGTGLAAEPVTIVCDGQRMAQSGISDPARVLSDMLGYLHRQRRVDTFIGLRAVTSETLNIVLPITALKINNVRLIDQRIDPIGSSETSSKLIITLDSLAARYGRSSFRSRTNEDQHEIDASDNFFSMVESTAQTERVLYWGKEGSSISNAPIGSTIGLPNWRRSGEVGFAF